MTAKEEIKKSNGGLLTVEGVDNGEAVAVYTTDGVKRGSSISRNRVSQISTNLMSGNIAILKIKDKSIKVIIK